MKELQQDLEEKEQMDILFIPLLSEMGNPCISVLHMRKCATQFTLELRKERSEAPQAIKSSRNIYIYIYNTTRCPNGSKTEEYCKDYCCKVIYRLSVHIRNLVE
jgi:hypothetical protein